MKIYWVIFVCGLFGPAKSEICAADLTMYDLPSDGMVKTMLSMATLGVVGYSGCNGPYTVDARNIGFWLYNKQNHDTPIRLDRHDPKEVNPNQYIVFITHGWTCNITGLGFPELKNAYLTRYPDANVIMIEWTKYSVDLYTNSYCYIPQIAEIFGEFICNLNTKYNVDISKLHLVGHSMGGQISGLTGQETKKQCGKTLGRITGLDPAGPIYQMQPASKRLDATDAKIVDVIHSNQGQFGYHGSCGTADFFPNCGYYQPKCLQLTGLMNMTAFLNLPFSVISCSHQRSIDYFTESINSNAFDSKSCTACPGLAPVGPCVADFIRASTAVMGEDYDKNSGTGTKFYLKTGSEAPYAKYRSN